MQSLFETAEYVEYVKRNCGVKDYDFKTRDTQCNPPDVDIILHYLAKMHIETESKLLEVGCGLGRILHEIYHTYNIMPYGVDLSLKIVEAARERVGKLCQDVKVSPAENIDFQDRFFDKVVCWGVFDLTLQNKSLFELARILSVGGKLLLSGKTNRYEIGDKEAYLAERGSLRKGIPNHYTDVVNLVEFARLLGLEVIDCWFFRFRGDLVSNKVEENSTEAFKQWLRNGSLNFDHHFYEYVMLFQKREHIVDTDYQKNIGFKRSLTGLKLDVLNNIEEMHA